MTGVSVLTIRDLLARLPPDLVRGDAELAYIAAGSRITLGDLDGADTFLQLAEANASSVP
jgi:hypothetical protein